MQGPVQLLSDAQLQKSFGPGIQQLLICQHVELLLVL